MTLDARRWLPFLLAGVALHSITLGILMLSNPLGVLRWVGWSYEGSRFFPAQSGLFLLILGVVYVGALWHRPLAWVLVLSKAFAVVFLLAETMAGNCPRIVYLPALADGAMGLVVAVSLIKARPRSELSITSRAGLY